MRTDQAGNRAAALEPQSEEAIMDFMKQNLDVEWTTYAQVNFRLWWLLNLEKVKKTEDGWVLA
jgi:hypothetical protein